MADRPVMHCTRPHHCATSGGGPCNGLPRPLGSGTVPCPYADAAPDDSTPYQCTGRTCSSCVTCWARHSSGVQCTLEAPHESQYHKAGPLLWAGNGAPPEAPCLAQNPPPTPGENTVPDADTSLMPDRARLIHPELPDLLVTLAKTISDMALEIKRLNNLLLDHMEERFRDCD